MNKEACLDSQVQKDALLAEESHEGEGENERKFHPIQEWTHERHSQQRFPADIFKYNNCIKIKFTPLKNVEFGGF